MSSEIDIGYLFPEMAAFIKENYPVDQAEVEKLISQKKRYCEEENKRRSVEDKQLWGISDPLTVLRWNAIELSMQTSGMSDHLLITLGAIQQMEKNLPEEERDLTPKQYLQYLLAAELTSAHRNANYWNKFEDVEPHTQKALKLLEFLKDFE